MAWESVPAELKELPQWVSWRDDKAPQIIGTNKLASTTKPETWSKFSADASRLGFVFTSDDPYVGIDLDVIDDETKLIAEKFDSYTEYSPSGSGLHIITRGKLPFAGKKRGAIECYGERRYFTVTGHAYYDSPIRENPESLSWFLEKYFPESKPHTTQIALPNAAQFDDSRILALVNNHPPAISKLGGHNKTFELACLLVEGFALSDEEAFQWLSYYNGKCQPEWSEKELWHKVHDARKKAVNIGHLLQGTTNTSVHVPLMIDRSDEEHEESPIDDYMPSDPGDLPLQMHEFEGLISLIAEYSLRTAHVPQPQLAIAGAIAMMSVITRGLTDRLNTRTNLYIVALAPSGAGKDTPRKTNKRLLIAAGEAEMAGPERLASSSGLVNFVEHRPATLFQLDEFGSLVENLQNKQATHLKNIADVLMQLYTSSGDMWTGDAFADRTKIKHIDQPHAVIFGTGTPKVFWDSLRKRNVTEGLVGRCMIFEVGRMEKRRMPEHVDASPLAEAIARWINRGSAAERMQGDTQLVPHSPDALKRLEAHFEAINSRAFKEENEGQHDKAAIWSRTQEKTSKLALLLAASRAVSPELTKIEIQDVERAIKLSNWSTRKLICQVYENVADEARERDIKLLLQIIKKRRKGISKTEITRSTRGMKSAYRTELLNELVETGLAEISEKKTNGRPCVVFCTGGVA